MTFVTKIIFLPVYNLDMLQFRPDLTEYRLYVEMLKDELNKDSILKMSLTDVIKILVEQAIQKNTLILK